MTKNVLITGANKGIGLRWTQEFLKEGAQVYATIRTSSSELMSLKDTNPNLTILHADISKEEYILHIKNSLKDVETLNVLIHNAGVYPRFENESISDDISQWAHGFIVNCMAPIFLSRALLPLFDHEGKKVIAALTSKMGSIGDNSSGGSYMYRSSKAALNAALKSLSIDLSSQGITVLALHPGWVLTDMGGHNALIDTETSVNGMKSIIDSATIADTGKFLDYTGANIPW